MKLLSGAGKLEKLGVQELKDLLVGRGGKPQGKKAKLVEMLQQDYSQPQAAAVGMQAAAEARTLEATLLAAQAAAAEAEEAEGAGGEADGAPGAEADMADAEGALQLGADADDQEAHE